MFSKSVEDCETNEKLNDDEIIAAVSKVHEEAKNKAPDDDKLPAHVSHRQTKKACDVDIQYIEQNEALHL